MGNPKATRSPQEGFTLVELLVVVAIIGILGSMAISQFAVYKRRAIDSEMQADLHHARTAMEAYYEGNNFTYSGATIPILEATYGFRGTATVTTQVLAADDTNYSLRACGQAGSFVSFRFDTTTGLIAGENVAC